MTAEASNGRLYLVPTPLDHGCDEQAALTEVLPLGTLQVAARLTH
ncbi:MAG TPA: ribosomal RNA small subunit methyltransferase I, partial [Ottowia sp.]|nr:ribosomal RNA small subunit methyltransferase I [Ottowia sp.]